MATPKPDLAARNATVLANMGLALTAARPFFDRAGWDRDDILQVAYLALVRAVDEFDPSLGRQFSTYAVTAMRREIRRWFQQRRLIRVPCNLLTVLGAYQRWSAAHPDAPFSEFGDGPTFAKRKGWLRNALDRRIPMVSICADSPIDEPVDFTTIKAIPEPDEIAEAAETLSNCLGRLDGFDRERRVIELFFGLDGTGGHSLEEIGKILGVSGERIRQIRNTAFRRMKPPDSEQAVA